MKDTLNKILNQINNKEGNSQELGYEALAVIKNILTENPNDIDALVTRMRLNADIFENSSEIIQDASFIAENENFGEDRMIGYDWLFWVYNQVLAMPDKAQETIEEQLIEIQNIYKKKYEKERKESELLNQLAQLKFDNDNRQEALTIWYKSYQKYPHLHQRNGFVGILFLEENDFNKATELLTDHYLWSFDTEDGFRLKYGIALRDLYEKGALNNQPDLIGLYYNVMRNEEAYFKLEKNLAFFEQHLPKLIEWHQQFPKNTLLLNAITNTYFFDTKNYEKAYEYFAKLFNSNQALRYSDLSRAHKAAKKSGNDFFEYNFNIEAQPNQFYSLLTNASSFYDKTKKKKKKKKYASLAVNFGKKAYDKYKNYIENGIGDTHCNQPHFYAMTCNNYANALGEYAEAHLKGDEKRAAYAKAGAIHMEGYEISPFQENLFNAVYDYFEGRKYKETIACALRNLTDYGDEFSVYDYQRMYWYLIRSYIALDDVANAEKYYFISKKLFNKVGKGSKDANYKFLFSAKLFLEFAAIKKEEYSKYIPEMEWFIKEEVAKKQEPNEHGLINHYLGICYKETGQKEKAIKAFQESISFLEDDEVGFYYDKSLEAENEILALGGKPEVKPLIVTKNKKDGFLSKIWKIITKPFKIIMFMVAIIIAASKTKGKKEKKG